VEDGNWAIPSPSAGKKKRTNLRRKGFGQFHPFELEIDQLAGDGEFVEVHSPIAVHVSQAPKRKKDFSKALKRRILFS